MQAAEIRVPACYKGLPTVPDVRLDHCLISIGKGRLDFPDSP
jgi:hypothetical protein